VVEQPKRIADLVAAWLSNGLATRMVFNLKLPMKKCFEEVQRDLDIVRQSLPQDGRLALKARQLYHDRKEVTVYVGPRQT
jgi:23S rRNA (cytidine2498-2'-O)-methyltransferase